MGELMGAHAGTHISRNEGTRKVSGERHISKKTLAASPSSDKSHGVEAFGVKQNISRCNHSPCESLRAGAGDAEDESGTHTISGDERKEGNRRWGGG